MTARDDAFGGEVELRDVVERYWPFDGPHSSEKVAAAALALSGLVRYLNNATGPGRSTLPYAASIHRVLSGLLGAVYGLEQLLRQLGEAIQRQAGDPTLYDDRGDRPGSATAALLGEQLLVTRAAVADLGERLSAATELSVHLGNDTEEHR